MKPAINKTASMLGENGISLSFFTYTLLFIRIFFYKIIEVEICENLRIFEEKNPG